VGIFGLQAVPTAISAFLFWPIIVTQIAGLIKEANLDKEALGVVEESLREHAARAASAIASAKQQICLSCGTSNAQDAIFCSQCGSRLAKPVADGPASSSLRA
jgi:ribosomal protein L40E